MTVTSRRPAGVKAPTGYVVVNPFNLPLRRFDTAAEASDWAREAEPYLGAFRVLRASAPVIRYSWREA